MKTPVAELLSTKKRELITLPATAPVFEAIQVMAKNSVGALPILNKAGKIAGILSERDCFRKVILLEKSPHDIRVQDVMTKKVTYVTPERTVEECMQIMTERKIRHLPVMEGDHLSGIISIGDCVKFILSEQDLMIHNLEKYIEGSL